MPAKDANKKTNQVTGLTLEGEIMLLTGSTVPWDAYYNVPMGSRYFRQNGDDWVKISDTDNTSEGWLQDYRLERVLPGGIMPSIVGYVVNQTVVEYRGDTPLSHSTLAMPNAIAGEYKFTSDFNWGIARAQGRIEVTLWAHLASTGQWSQLSLHRQGIAVDDDAPHDTMISHYILAADDSLTLELRFYNTSNNRRATLYSSSITAEI